MSKVTMTNAKAKSGAALFVSYDSVLELDSCSFSNLNARASGGITLLSANATIHDSIFTKCKSIQSGSGIYADDSHLFITNTIMQDMNAEKSGSAISAQNKASLDISHSQFLKCHSNTGGLIDLQNNSTLTMSSSTFNEFTASAIVGDTANIKLLDVNIWNGTSLHSTSPVECTK